MKEHWDRTISDSENTAIEYRDKDYLRVGLVLAVESISSLLNFCKFLSESLSLKQGLLRDCFMGYLPLGSAALALKSSRFHLGRAG